MQEGLYEGVNRNLTMPSGVVVVCVYRICGLSVRMGVQFPIPVKHFSENILQIMSCILAEQMFAINVF